MTDIIFEVDNPPVLFLVHGSSFTARSSYD